jgi:hypothetical protein
MKKPKRLTFDGAMRLMRSTDPETAEAGFWELQQRAAEEIDRLIDAYQRETDIGLRCSLLELIGEARTEKAFPVLEAALRGPEPSLHLWAACGLRQLNTKDARRLLWEATTWELGSRTETEEFRDSLRRAD